MNDEEIKDFWERSHRSHEAFGKVRELCEKYAAGTDPKQLVDAADRALAAIDADFQRQWWEAGSKRIRLSLWRRWRNAWEMFWVYLLGDGQGNKWP